MSNTIRHNTTPRSPHVPHTVTFENTGKDTSRSSSRASSHLNGRKPLNDLPRPSAFQENFSESDEDMDDRRPPLHRPSDGRSHQPLLRQDEERGRVGYGDDIRPTFSRRSTMRSRSPDTQAKLATRKKYTYAAFFLGLSLISFTIQTETAVYIQHELGWNKAYCML